MSSRVVAVAAGQGHGHGIPCASAITWRLEPGRARSTGARTADAPHNTAPLILAARKRRGSLRQGRTRPAQITPAEPRSPSKPLPARPASPAPLTYTGPTCAPRTTAPRRHQPRRHATHPASQRASDTSLLRRLAEASQRNHQLAEEPAGSAASSALGDQCASPRPARQADADHPAGRRRINR